MRKREPLAGHSAENRAIVDCFHQLDIARVECEEKQGSSLNLRKVDLRQANLKEAYLKGANLEMADLNGAGLSGARVTQSQIDQARYSSTGPPRLDRAYDAKDVKAKKPRKWRKSPRDWLRPPVEENWPCGKPNPLALRDILEVP